MTEESRISKEIKEFALDKRIYSLARYQAQSSLNGLPDRLFLYKGILLGIEVKTPKGKPTLLQIKKVTAINENGGIGVIVDDVKQFMRLYLIINEKYNYCKNNNDFDSWFTFILQDRTYYENMIR